MDFLGFFSKLVSPHKDQRSIEALISTRTTHTIAHSNNSGIQPLPRSNPVSGTTCNNSLEHRSKETAIEPTETTRYSASSSNSELATSTMLALCSNLPAGMARNSWCISDYVIHGELSSGYASIVYQATCKHSGHKVALKVYRMDKLSDLSRHQVFREIRIHASLQHPNIIHLFAAFQEGNSVVLVQEFAEGGDLYACFTGSLKEERAVEVVLRPLLGAVQYLHSHGIIHRDIKLENILLTSDCGIKLADFGLAIDLREERAVTRAGTLGYMAPEVLQCPCKTLPEENKQQLHLHYSFSVDAWAIGVLAYELVVGSAPFTVKTKAETTEVIANPIDAATQARVSSSCKSFISQALQKHPGDRPTVAEMLHSPWFQSYQHTVTPFSLDSVQQAKESTTFDASSAGVNANSAGVNASSADGSASSDQMQARPGVSSADKAAASVNTPTPSDVPATKPQISSSMEDAHDQMSTNSLLAGTKQSSASIMDRHDPTALAAFRCSAEFTNGDAVSTCRQAVQLPLEASISLPSCGLPHSHFKGQLRAVPAASQRQEGKPDLDLSKPKQLQSVPAVMQSLTPKPDLICRGAAGQPAPQIQEKELLDPVVAFRSGTKIATGMGVAEIDSLISRLVKAKHVLEATGQQSAARTITTLPPVLY